MSEMEKENNKNQPEERPEVSAEDQPYQAPEAQVVEDGGPGRAQLGAVQRLIGVLTKPSEAFKDFRNKNGASFLLPLFLLILFGMASTYAFILRVDKDEYVAATMELMPPMVINAMSQSMGPEEVYDTLATNIRNGMPMAGMNIAVGVVIMSLLSTLIIFGIGKLVGSKAKFGQVLTVYSFALGVPIAIKEMLGLILNLVRDPNSMIFEGIAHQFVASNPAVIIGVDTLGLKGFSILANLDLFLIWTLVLQVIGISVVGRMTKGRAAIPVLGTWFLFLTCSLGALLIFQ